MTHYALQHVTQVLKVNRLKNSLFLIGFKDLES